MTCIVEWSVMGKDNKLSFTITNFKKVFIFALLCLAYSFTRFFCVYFCWDSKNAYDYKALSVDD